MTISKINITTYSLSVQDYPEKNVKSSMLGVSHVPLEDEDIFSLQTFKELQEERFANNMDLYICVVKENDHFFFFEGSRFIEAFLNEGKKLKNPMTRKEIENFEVLFSSKNTPVFETYKMQEEVAIYPHYLPILWNDPIRTIEERADYLYRMGDCYHVGRGVENNTDVAVYFYEKATKIGRLEPQIELSGIFYDKMEYITSFYWLVKFLESGSSKITVQHILCAADGFQTGKYIPQNSFYSTFYYKKAALLGNSYAIANLVLKYKRSDGIAHDKKKASLWKKYISKEYNELKRKNIKAIKKSKTYRKETQTLSLPKELLEDEPELHPPDADALFPEVKEDFDRRVTPENLYHFSLEEIERIKRSTLEQGSPEGYEADSELNPTNKV